MTPKELRVMAAQLVTIPVDALEAAEFCERAADEIERLNARFRPMSDWDRFGRTLKLAIRLCDYKDELIAVIDALTALAKKVS